MRHGCEKVGLELGGLFDLLRESYLLSYVAANDRGGTQLSAFAHDRKNGDFHIDQGPVFLHTLGGELFDPLSPFESFPHRFKLTKFARRDDEGGRLTDRFRSRIAVKPF